MKRAISLISALALVLALTPCALADSPAYGSDVWLQDTNLQDGVVMSDNLFWSDAYSKPRHEYLITYSPNGRDPGEIPAVPGAEPESSETPPDTPSEPADDFDLDLPEWLQSGGAAASVVSYSAASGVQPVVYYGSSVCNLTTTTAAAKYYEDNGYRVLGAVNGDFFDMSIGYPLGIMVSAGELLSGSSEYYAMGVRKDGSIVMGAPNLSITAKSDTGGSAVIWGLNKPRVNKGGIAMITYDYRTDHQTRTTSAGVNVLAHIIGGRASIGEQLVLQVEEVLEESKSYTLRKDQVLLTAAANGYSDATGFLRSLMRDQTVTVSFSSPDSRWNDVTEAIGALYLLVEDGTARTGFDGTAAPRTAVGVKENGDLIIYALDGRQDSVSMGASLGVLAKRMQELGCVTALCLDGGGSTTFVASTPDKYSYRTINSPSDKSLRSVTNHLVLIGPGGMTGQPGAVNLSASAPAVLAGHTVKLTANLADTHYYPMEGGSIHFAAESGTIDGNVFTAPETGGPVTITAYSDYPGAVPDQVTVQVLDAPQYVSVRRNGSAVSSLNLKPQETVQLSLAGSYAHRNIEIFPSDYTWTVEPAALGEVDQNGVLTIFDTEGTGTVTASRGSSAVSFSLTVKDVSPFADTDGHWAEKYMTSLYRKGVLTGVDMGGGKLYAYPDRGVTRAEFSVLLARYLRLDTSAYAAVETPFPDLGPVESWAGSAVRAMYSMGIVGGMESNGQTVFNPQGTLTRAEAVTMLGRLLAQNETEPEALARTDLSVYADADAIPEFAREHFALLTALNAVDADGAGNLNPGSAMTRAVICKALSVLEGAF